MFLSIGSGSGSGNASDEESVRDSTGRPFGEEQDTTAKCIQFLVRLVLDTYPKVQMNFPRLEGPCCDNDEYA
jgi:hypothetical protein